MVELICEQGDIVSLNFDPSLSHEPAGRHYAIVVSPWEVNSRCSLTLVAPVTSRDNGFPLHVRIAEGNPIFGFVQCEALRAVDLESRELAGKAQTVGELDEGTLSEVLAVVKVVVGLD